LHPVPWFQGGIQNFLFQHGRQYASGALPLLLSLNGLHPTLGKSGSGGDHRGTRHPDLLRNCVIGHAFGSQQDHLAFACHLLGCASGS